LPGAGGGRRSRSRPGIAKKLDIRAERPDSADGQALIAELERSSRRFTLESRHGYSGGGLELVDGEYGELKRMYVRPQLRGRGFGKLMLEHLAAHARAYGIILLRLETGIHQGAAIALYEASGFRRIAPFGAYREDPLSAFYEKRI
jgi:putative acetyltransferase